MFLTSLMTWPANGALVQGPLLALAVCKERPLLPPTPPPPLLCPPRPLPPDGELKWAP